ncbi:hypothetical protein GCM10010967_55730 [Dyadobacter beijingensis]|uniref:histidine kinase n=2 Tax=Dyadobacter beijingensis TaxID=365489 RepID=A0ABQ2IL66_9BACT|nr:hypothetical protein GCM10010967_55730 [Dyadobacter beijingensis]
MRLVFGSLALSLFAAGAYAQPDLSGYDDVAKKRLLIRVTAQYIHTISQGQVDMDSAIRIPCKVYRLSPLLPYNEGYSDGTPSPGSRLIDAGNITEARSLLSKLRGEARLRLLLELGTYYVFKPGSDRPDLANASKYIQEALTLSEKAPVRWKIESLILQGHWLHQSGRPEESQGMFTQAEALARHAGNALAAARAALNAGELTRYGQPERVARFEKALTVFKAIHAKEKEIEAISQINIENFITKKYDLAEGLLQKIVQLQAAIHFRHQQYPLDALSWLAYRKGALTNALAYSNRSMACLASKADSVFAPYFYIRRGVVYDRLFKYPEALVWFDKGLATKSAETKLIWYRSVIGKVGVLNLMGRWQEALALLKEMQRDYPPDSYFEKMHFAYLLGITFENLKNFPAAERNFNVFLEMADQFPIDYIFDEFPHAYFNISSFYRIIGKTARSRELLEKGRNFASTFDILANDNYYYNLYKLDSTEGNYLEAIKNLNLSYQFTDSVFSYEQRKRAEELLVKYEAEKKDKSIKLLDSQNQLERVRAEQAHRTKNITLAGLLLLLIIVLLLLNRYLIKQRSNRQLEANQRELDQKNTFLETLNAEQDKLLKEKEWLIKEVHHRVKNNLQMVTSLLYSQSVYLEDDAAILAVKDSLRRMQAMSLIHQKLYQDENTTTISMPEYIADLARYLHESFDDGGQITFRQEIESLELDVSQAIPLGLIVTESIVNAIKYAFLNGKKGTVCIELKHDGPDHLLLRIADNGIGLPPGLDTMQHNSLGLELMQGLAGQLNGTLAIENNQGVQVTVRFLVSNR